MWSKPLNLRDWSLGCSFRVREGVSITNGIGEKSTRGSVFRKTVR